MTSEKVLQSSRNGGFLRHAIPPSDFLQILAQRAYIGNGETVWLILQQITGQIWLRFDEISILC